MVKIRVHLIAIKCNKKITKYKIKTIRVKVKKFKKFRIAIIKAKIKTIIKAKIKNKNL